MEISRDELRLAADRLREALCHIKFSVSAV